MARTAIRPGRKPKSQHPAKPRAARQVERREAILAAALDEFSASGFAAARLDDVARRAGVAKGTIYLYFRDKESLFQELVRAMLGAAGAARSRPRRWPICRRGRSPSHRRYVCATKFSAPAARM